MSWLFQPLPNAGAESLSSEPTSTPATILNSAPIGHAEWDTPTLGKLQSGRVPPIKFVVLVEGCKYVPSDAPQAAVQAALRGTDWETETVLPGLFVHLQNQQSINPWDAFPTGGSCQLRVVDTDRSDVFGKFVNRRAGGDETTITSTIDRNDLHRLHARQVQPVWHGAIRLGRYAVRQSPPRRT
jgi:hypothetical protein